MNAPVRLAAALAAVAVSVALPFARTQAGPDPEPATASFTAMGLSFRYPATWRHASFTNDVSSFSANVVDLSTGRLHDTCLGGPAQGALVCSGFPVDTLAPGGVLVEWTAHGFPGWGAPTANTTIGGLPAIETRNNDAGWCTSLGGTETITVMIPRDLPGNWYEMDACLRAPALPQLEAQISALLRTVRIAEAS